MCSLQDAPFIVCQEEDAEAVCFILKPAKPEAAVQAAPLEVVRQVGISTLL